MPLPFWLYRTGLYFLDGFAKRAMFGETWLSTDVEASVTDVNLEMNAANELLKHPFTSAAGMPAYAQYSKFVEIIYPRHKILTGFNWSPMSGTILNPDAPEAAFRLQRVGALASGSSGVGRLCPPIHLDNWYTDVPQRRHVDLSVLAPKIAAGIETFPKVRTRSGRTYTNVVFNFRALTWTAVDHYNLITNPVRIWNRWRTYDYVHRHAKDNVYSPWEL